MATIQTHFGNKNKKGKIMTKFIEQAFSTIFGDNIILATILIAIIPIIELKGAIPFSMSFGGQNTLSQWTAFAYAFLGSSLIVPVLALVYAPLISALKKTKLFRKLALKIEERVKQKKEKIEQKALEQKSLELKTSNNININLNENNELNSNKTNTNKQLNANGQEVQSINNKDNSNKDNKENNNKTSNQNANKIAMEQEKISKTEKHKKFDKVFLSKFFGVFLFVAVPLPLTGVWTGTCIAVCLGLGFWWTCLAVISGNAIAGLLVTLCSSLLNPLVTFYLFLGLVAFVIVASLIYKYIKKQKVQKTNN